MGEVNHEAVIGAPRETVFAYVDDYRNVPHYFLGLKSFTPTTDQLNGVGATFAAAVKVGPKELKSIMRCTQWADGELIALESSSGFGASTRWRMSDGPSPETTRLMVDFSYTLPGGLAGRVLGPLLAPFAEQAVKYTESRIREALEG